MVKAELFIDRNICCEWNERKRWNFSGMKRQLANRKIGNEIKKYWTSESFRDHEHDLLSWCAWGWTFGECTTFCIVGFRAYAFRCKSKPITCNLRKIYIFRLPRVTFLCPPGSSRLQRHDCLFQQITIFIIRSRWQTHVQTNFVYKRNI